MDAHPTIPKHPASFHPQSKSTTLIRRVSDGARGGASGHAVGSDSGEQSVPEVALLVDLSRCVACKGCEVACKAWNQLPPRIAPSPGSLQSHPDLSPTTWLLVPFAEVEEEGRLRWLLGRRACHHCGEPSCLQSCPAPGAIIQYENGAVVYDEERCIGCGACVGACPFAVPRLDPEAGKASKCDLCFQRLEAGMGPACAKTCPTGALSFGTREAMVSRGRERVLGLLARGLTGARLYDPPGVGGTHQIFVIPFGEHLAEYGLPSDPRASSGESLLSAGVGPLGSASKGGSILGVLLGLMMADVASDGDGPDMPDPQAGRDGGGDVD